jgi:hypothetical protein
MVNIKGPLNPVQKRGLWPPKGAREYTVLDSDDWWKIAAREHIDVWALIEFNFQTRVPEEVNWYLRELVGCRHTKDGRNYAFFGADQKRRKIYLPVVAPPVPPQVRKYPTYGLYFRRYAPFDTFGVPSFEGDKRAVERIRVTFDPSLVGWRDLSLPRLLRTKQRTVRPPSNQIVSRRGRVDESHASPARPHSTTRARCRREGSPGIAIRGRGAWFYSDPLCSGGPPWPNYHKHALDRLVSDMTQLAENRGNQRLSATLDPMGS